MSKKENAEEKKCTWSRVKVVFARASFFIEFVILLIQRRDADKYIKLRCLLAFVCNLCLSTRDIFLPHTQPEDSHFALHSYFSLGRGAAGRTKCFSGARDSMVPSRWWRRDDELMTMAEHRSTAHIARCRRLAPVRTQHTTTAAEAAKIRTSPISIFYK